MFASLWESRTCISSFLTSQIKSPEKLCSLWVMTKSSPSRHRGCNKCQTRRVHLFILDVVNMREIARTFDGNCGIRVDSSERGKAIKTIPSAMNFRREQERLLDHFLDYIRLEEEYSRHNQVSRGIIENYYPPSRLFSGIIFPPTVYPTLHVFSNHRFFPVLCICHRDIAYYDQKEKKELTIMSLCRHGLVLLRHSSTSR